MDLSDDKEGEFFSPPTISPSPQAQALETVSHTEEVIPPSVSNKVDFSYLQGSRIFLDLCSGAGHPLTSAMLQRNCICFPVDKLICDDMDILNNSFFEPLLRVCSSGCVGYAGAAPNCGEYSRLKLKPHGPPALRTPEFMQGLPGLTPAQLDRVQASYELMTRCVLCLELVYSAGGHVHLEQPTNSMAWLEAEVRRFIKFCAIFLVNFPACAFSRNWNKSWLLACSYPALKSLGSICNHPKDSHEPISGVRHADGTFKSRDTAEDPEPMCAAIANLIAPLCASDTGQQLTWTTVQQCIPVKGYCDFPVSYEDGGGLNSEPDWSRPHRATPDSLKQLRQDWVQLILHNGMLDKMQAFFRAHEAQPPFSAEDLAPFRHSMERFIQSHGMIADWSIRMDQPMHLEIMAAISRIMQDKDNSLFDMLRHGAPTGIQSDIPPSTIFPRAEDKADDSIPLSIHMTNWQSAESDLETTRDLVNQELEKGWIYEYHGTLADAQAEFGDKLAIGRLGLDLSDHRPPRLVVDSSICGLNSRCSIPERTTLPSALDVMRVYPLRETQEQLVGFSLDIKSAHKLVVIRTEERGLLGFTLDNKIYFYKVAPFGATFSAYHWTRVGSFILRFFHHLLWWIHAGFLYVDDYLFLFPQSVALIMACELCIASQILNIPISWRKSEFGARIHWIGWQFEITSGYIALPLVKLEKLRNYITQMIRSSRTSKKALEKLVGLLNWVTQIFLLMRCWLPILYKDLFHVPASHFSIDPGHWRNVMACLDNDLKFTSAPTGTGIPVGSTLLAIRHQNVSSLSDLNNIYLSERRTWLRIRDMQSSKRCLSSDSIRILHMFSAWLQSLSLVKCLRPKQLWTGECAADACAHGDTCQIGGFIRFPSGTAVWFSETFSYAKFESMHIPVSKEMQKCIACFETLAQIAILFIFSRSSPGFRYPLRIPSLTDNTGAEAGGNKLFSMSSPMNLFLEKLTLLCTFSGMELDLSHISGERNEEADALSRWDESTPPPFQHLLQNRFPLTLEQLWHPETSVAVYPPETFLAWQLP